MAPLAWAMRFTAILPLASTTKIKRMPALLRKRWKRKSEARMTIPAPAPPAGPRPPAGGRSRSFPGAAAACRRRRYCQGAAARRVAATAMERRRSGCWPVRKALPGEPGSLWDLVVCRRPAARAAGSWATISSGNSPGRGSTGPGGSPAGGERSSAGAPGSGPEASSPRPCSGWACSCRGPVAGFSSTGRARGHRTSRAAISRSSSDTWLRPTRAAWARAARMANRSSRCPSSPSRAAAVMSRRRSSSEMPTWSSRLRASRMDSAAEGDGAEAAGTAAAGSKPGRPPS